MNTNVNSTVNGKMYWTSENGKYGIWYTSSDKWIVGTLDEFGESSGYLISLVKNHHCPNNIAYKYWNGTDWIKAEQDIEISCDKRMYESF